MGDCNDFDCNCDGREKIPVDPDNRRKIVLGVLGLAGIIFIAFMAFATIKKMVVGPDKVISSEQFK